MPQCKICSTPLRVRPTGSPKLYCSPKCKLAAKHQRQKASGTYAAKYERQRVRRGRVGRWDRPAQSSCDIPGCDRPHRARGFCSHHYRVDAAARGVPWAVRYFETGGDRRRARAAGVAYEPISRPLLFERDQWVCAICSDPVDRTACFPHPLSASLDHIVPIARGGDHLWTNVQCAHLRCNVRKRDSIAEVA